MHNRRSSLAQHFQSRGGNTVPRRYSTEEVTDGFQRVLQQEYGHLKKPSGALSEDSGTSERAARNHLSGESLMNLTDFFNACQTIPVLQQWGASMMGLKPSDPRWQSEVARLARAYYEHEQRGEP